MKSIKIFDEYAEIKKKMHQRPRYDDIQYSINHPNLFKAPDRRASRL
jgi:hypothetical protein